MLNLFSAAILSLLALWLVVADFSYPGDLMFQMSASLTLSSLFAALLALAVTAVSALPIRMVTGINLLLVIRCALGFPLNLWMSNTAACRVATAAYLVLTLAYLGMCLTRRQQLAARPWFQRRHTLRAAIASVLLMLVTLPLFGLGWASGVKNFSGDYASLSPTSVNLAEREFQKDGRTVHLVPMMHIGDRKYYADLDARMQATPPAGVKRLILTEGVSDRDHLLPSDFASGRTYERFAKMLGLQAQQKASARVTAHPSAATPAASATAPDPVIVTRNADIDVADLAEPYRTQLMGLLNAISSGNPLAVNREALNITGEQLEALLKNGLLLSRNEVLMKRFHEASGEFNDIYIPWGAAHLPDIEARLRALGYRQTGEVSRPIMRFGK